MKSPPSTLLPQILNYSAHHPDICTINSILGYLGLQSLSPSKFSTSITHWAISLLKAYMRIDDKKETVSLILNLLSKVASESPTQLLQSYLPLVPSLVKHEIKGTTRVLLQCIKTNNATVLADISACNVWPLLLSFAPDTETINECIATLHPTITVPLQATFPEWCERAMQTATGLSVITALCSHGFTTACLSLKPLIAHLVALDQSHLLFEPGIALCSTIAPFASGWALDRLVAYTLSLWFAMNNRRTPSLFAEQNHDMHILFLLSRLPTDKIPRVFNSAPLSSLDSVFTESIEYISLYTSLALEHGDHAHLSEYIRLLSLNQSTHSLLNDILLNTTSSQTIYSIALALPFTPQLLKTYKQKLYLLSTQHVPLVLSLITKALYADQEYTSHFISTPSPDFWKATLAHPSLSLYATLSLLTTRQAREYAVKYCPIQFYITHADTHRAALSLYTLADFKGKRHRIAPVEHVLKESPFKEDLGRLLLSRVKSEREVVKRLSCGLSGTYRDVLDAWFDGGDLEGQEMELLKVLREG